MDNLQLDLYGLEVLQQQLDSSREEMKRLQEQLAAVLADSAARGQAAEDAGAGAEQGLLPPERPRTSSRPASAAQVRARIRVLLQQRADGSSEAGVRVRVRASPAVARLAGSAYSPRR